MKPHKLEFIAKGATNFINIIQGVLFKKISMTSWLSNVLKKLKILNGVHNFLLYLYNPLIFSNESTNRKTIDREYYNFFMIADSVTTHLLHHIE